MIKSIRIKNFRCLRDVTVALDSLTVLVGPNGSGKSTLLDAIVTLARLTRSPLHGKSGEFDFGRPGWQGSASFEQAAREIDSGVAGEKPVEVAESAEVHDVMATPISEEGPQAKPLDSDIP